MEAGPAVSFPASPRRNQLSPSWRYREPLLRRWEEVVRYDGATRESVFVVDLLKGRK